MVSSITQSHEPGLLKRVLFSEQKSTLVDIYFWLACLFFLMLADLSVWAFLATSALWLVGRSIAARKQLHLLFALGVVCTGVLVYLAVFHYHASSQGAALNVATLLVLILLAAITGLFRKASV